MSMISSGKIINAFLWSCFACHFYRVQHLVDILQQRAILLKKRYWEHPIYCKFPIISCYTIMSTFYRIHQQSFITFTLLHDLFQHNAKYVTYTNDITKKKATKQPYRPNDKSTFEYLWLQYHHTCIKLPEKEKYQPWPPKSLFSAHELFLQCLKIYKW